MNVSEMVSQLSDGFRAFLELGSVTLVCALWGYFIAKGFKSRHITWLEAILLGIALPLGSFCAVIFIIGAITILSNSWVENLESATWWMPASWVGLSWLVFVCELWIRPRRRRRVTA